MATSPNITNNAFTAASGSAAARVQSIGAQAQNSIANSQEKLKNAGDKVSELSQQQKEKLDSAKQVLENKQKFLQDQANIDPATAKTAIVGLVLPLLVKFINTEKIATSIINNLIRTTKKRLKDKGRVEVNGGSIVFYPKNPGEYSRFKKDFDNKVNKLKQIVKTLKTIIDSLITVLKVLKIALVALQLQLKLKKKKLLATAAASAPDLAGPLPNKPIAAKYPIEKEIDDQVTKKIEDKINNYILMITVIQSILQIFQKMINSLKAKLEILSFTISTNPVSNSNISVDINEIDDSGLTEYSDGTRNYTIEIITTPAGDLQAVAYDSFSKLKITQTAPSKTRKAEELINELKQILG